MRARARTASRRTRGKSSLILGASIAIGSHSVACHSPTARTAAARTRPSLALSSFSSNGVGRFVRESDSYNQRASSCARSSDCVLTQASRSPRIFCPRSFSTRRACSRLKPLAVRSCRNRSVLSICWKFGLFTSGLPLAVTRQIRP